MGAQSRTPPRRWTADVVLPMEGCCCRSFWNGFRGSLMDAQPLAAACWTSLPGGHSASAKRAMSSSTPSSAVWVETHRLRFRLARKSAQCRGSTPSGQGQATAAFCAVGLTREALASSGSGVRILSLGGSRVTSRRDALRARQARWRSAAVGSAFFSPALSTRMQASRSRPSACIASSMATLKLTSGTPPVDRGWRGEPFQ